MGIGSSFVDRASHGEYAEYVDFGRMVSSEKLEILRREESMKLRIHAVAVSVLLALSIALSAQAGDIDGDLVDDSVDNCSFVPNGPNDPSNQVDTDEDGFGNSCDCDFTQDLITLGDDFVLLYAAFNTTQELHDIDGDGFVLGSDIIFCSNNLGGSPG